MRVTPCRSYHSKTVQRTVVRMPDKQSVFKVYYVSIIGRDEPSRFEWAHCSIQPHDFEDRLMKSKLEGVGFVTAFPHITKVFRFAPAGETVMHVRAFNTPELTTLDLAREDGHMEFACYAEAAIAAEEYAFWASAKTVEEYLARFSAFEDGPIARHDKLSAYWLPR